MDEGKETYKKAIFWLCTYCEDHTEEVKEVPPDTERKMLTRRLLKASNDYDLESASIESGGDELIFRVRFPRYDANQVSMGFHY